MPNSILLISNQKRTTYAIPVQPIQKQVQKISLKCRKVMIDTSDKEAARILKDTDKEMALNDKYVCAACFDLQKVLFSTKNSLLGKMGEYEKEQARLQELMQDVIDEETKDAEPDVTAFDKLNLSQFYWLEIEEFEMRLLISSLVQYGFKNLLKQGKSWN
jgi:hypothetical protein